MKALVLVGGEGTRLRPLTYKTPKALLPVANVPFVERQLSWLASHGVDEAVLSLGYLPDAFRHHFADGRFGAMAVRFREEPEPLGTAGGIRFAAEGIDERVVVCNGDVLTDLNLSAMIAFHAERGAEATISLARVDDPSAFGVVPTRPDGEVVAFVEKPPPGQAPTHWINAGTYVLEPSVLQRIPPRLTVSIERETFPRMLSRPRSLFGYRSDAYWLDIGTPGKYLDAHADVLAGRLGRPPAPHALERSPGVWVQGDPRIDREATLGAPVLIGPGASIGTGATVVASTIGADAVVGSGARISGSVVLPGAVVAEGREVVDSVVGPDVELSVP